MSQSALQEIKARDRATDIKGIDKQNKVNKKSPSSGLSGFLKPSVVSTEQKSGRREFVSLGATASNVL